MQKKMLVSRYSLNTTLLGTVNSFNFYFEFTPSPKSPFGHLHHKIFAADLAHHAGWTHKLSRAHRRTRNRLS
ncbi:hypothetical protein DSUL_20369 [Desulfovibrionales bacterium]